MEETKRNSMKLDIEAVRLSDSERDLPKESYKSIPEYPVLVGTAAKNSNMVREKGDNIEDGADETMLDGSEKEQLAQKDEVKFIAGDHKNGDAKIDIGETEKSFTGMTKDELMKYANDPFWVRLRWICFILFWGLWIAMLIGAIMIIIGAPKCAAPSPLAWYKQGPLVLAQKFAADPEEIKNLKSIGAKGVIFSLPPNETYRTNTEEVTKKIKDLVDQFKAANLNVILDITPNYVSQDDELFQKAVLNETYRSAFVWINSNKVPPTNWISKDGSTAWDEIKDKNFVLSQFGKGQYDLQLNDTFAKDKFKAVLLHLVELGVKGFRVANAKHFIIDTTEEPKDDEPAQVDGKHGADYSFWTHSQTTYQQGLGDLLYEYASFIKNVTKDEGFLSVTENIVKPEAFKVSKFNSLAIELPVYGLLPHSLAGTGSHVAKQLKAELTSVVNALGNGTWVQWQYDQSAMKSSIVDYSEYTTFLMLLPGVPIATYDAFAHGNDTRHLLELEEMRQSPSYMHGSFDVYTDANETIIAYSRIKSGNPGYFVAYNPNDNGVSSDFSAVKGMPEQLTVLKYSKNFNLDKITEKSKISASAIPIAAHSVIILTYVPKSD